VWDRTVIPLRDQIFPIKDLFGRAILQTTLPKEEPEEPFFFTFIVKNGSSPLELLCWNCFLRKCSTELHHKNREAGTKTPQETEPNRP
jgi:hypothetical protein